jgi:hypothetical protein
MSRFRKKPVVIEAEEFDPSRPREQWPEGVRAITGRQPNGYVIFDSAQNGDVPVNPGDWIITGVQGERYPCKADIFAATYDPVEEDVPLPF